MLIFFFEPAEAQYISQYKNTMSIRKNMKTLPYFEAMSGLKFLRTKGKEELLQKLHDLLFLNHP